MRQFDALEERIMIAPVDYDTFVRTYNAQE